MQLHIRQDLALKIGAPDAAVHPIYPKLMAGLNPPDQSCHISEQEQHMVNDVVLFSHAEECPLVEAKKVN